MLPRSRPSVVLAFGLIVLLALGAGGLLWLTNPGDKGDTTTGLLTPTLAPADMQPVRVFDVSPAESTVEFSTEVRGIRVEGVFPVAAGTITLEPAEDALLVHVYLEIAVDEASTGNALVDRTLRAAMATGDYPLAFYVATSRGTVPVTEDVVTFTLDGDLDVHNVAQAHRMAVEAQLVGGDLWAVAISDLDLGQHGVEFPAIFGSTTIALTARLQAYEAAGDVTPDGPGNAASGWGRSAPLIQAAPNIHSAG